VSDHRDKVTHTEVLAPEPAEALANLIATTIPNGALPPLWHWLYLLERRPHADLGPDGHPTFGVPAPPGPGRRRMFAGGRVSTFCALRLGYPATRTTWVTGTVQKEGRTGPLTFVTVRNEYAQDGQIAIVDENDIVYRPAYSRLPTPSRAPQPGPVPGPGQPTLSLEVDQALLFRFSALTYNAHRIHYDHEWVRQEGYQDLVVHGPLQALMMGELVRWRGQGLVGKLFRYLLVSPMIGPQTLTVQADPAGVDVGAQVRDALGTVTAVCTLETMISETG